MSDELKPCPFCGGEAVINPTFHDFYALCLGCCVSTPPLPSEEMVAEAWNRRVGKDTPDPMGDMEKEFLRAEEEAVKAWNRRVG